MSFRSFELRSILKEGGLTPAAKLIRIISHCYDAEMHWNSRRNIFWKYWECPETHESRTHHSIFCPQGCWTGAPPLPDDRNLRPITNSSDIYVKYLFSCYIGSVDKNNSIYCHGGGIKNWKFEKKSWESTGNYLICFQFNFYLKTFKHKKVRVILIKLQKKVFSATFRRCETPFFKWKKD